MATTFNQSQNEEVQVMLKLENLLAAGDLVIQQQIKQLGQNLTSGIVYKLVTENSLKLEKFPRILFESVHLRVTVRSDKHCYVCMRELILC